MEARTIMADTWFNGTRYRSRHEARWAALLGKLGDSPRTDHLYEPEDVTVPGVGRYLPDFLFEYWDLWGEVKLNLTRRELRRLLAIAKGLSGRRCGAGRDLVVFGRIPAGGDLRFPVRLHGCRRRLWAHPWCPWVDGGPGNMHPEESVGVEVVSLDDAEEILLYGLPPDASWLLIDHWCLIAESYLRAANYARNARFE